MVGLCPEGESTPATKAQLSPSTSLARRNPAGSRSEQIPVIEIFHALGRYHYHDHQGRRHDKQYRGECGHRYAQFIRPRRDVPSANQGWDYGMSHKDVEAETDIKDEDEPDECEEVSDVAPIGAGDVMWIHVYSLISQKPTSTYQPHPPKLHVNNRQGPSTKFWYLNGAFKIYILILLHNDYQKLY